MSESSIAVGGSIRRWCSEPEGFRFEYVQDQIESGKNKALIILGHVVSEQAGMKYCAEWLREFVPEVPVEFVPAPEPYWSPEDLPA